MKSIAIIGTSIGQKGLYSTAKRLGLRSIGFSKPNLTNDISYLADVHYNISVNEIEAIIDVCRKYSVIGVISNGSDFTAKCANEIAYKLNLPCNNPQNYLNASDKNYVREVTSHIAELTPIKHKLYHPNYIPTFPCIIKPQTSGGKIGLSIASDLDSFQKAIEYALSSCDCEILIEDYIDGLELSVEVLSSQGKHFVIQTCEAETSGAPHFVEIAHHLPANISNDVYNKIRRIVPQILDAIHFENGATDIEMKVDNDGNIYLIEVNLRGAGGNITNQLVELSTGYSYLQGLIEISMGKFNPPTNLENNYVGDYYLCKQTESLIPLFKNAKNKNWLIESTINSSDFKKLKPVCTNGDREGYIIYKANRRITKLDA